MKIVMFLVVCLLGCSPWAPATPFTQEQCRQLCSPMPVALWTPGCYNDERKVGLIACGGEGKSLPDVCRCGNVPIQTEIK